MPNLQAPSPRSVSDGRTLMVHSIFYTLQGEGPYVGRPAVFVRLAGCNLQCPQCDTEYTIGAHQMGIEEITAKIYSVIRPGKSDALVVITGGEPFRQPLTQFVKLLIENRFTVQIETNGTQTADQEAFSFPQWLTWAKNKRLCVVCSPKTHHVAQGIQTLVEINGAYKYVAIADDLSAMDGLPVIALGLKLHRSTLFRPPAGSPAPIYLQPANYCDNFNNPDDFVATHAYRDNVAACVRSCLRFGYILSIQTHKIIGVE